MTSTTIFSLIFFIYLISFSYSYDVMDEVVILEQPQSGFIIKSRPYQLTCKALNAKKIRFKCNNRWMDESRYESILGTDPASQLPYMESTLEITRQEVEANIELNCQCYASGPSDDHVLRSDNAEIRIAYMRKHFLEIPTSQRVAEGAPAQLICNAPESEPKATIVWIKDGEVIERFTDSHVIYGSDGSLIFSSTRLSDDGNYTCEASNVAHKRQTEPATLHVFVNGGWSEWSIWNGHCDVDCDLLRYQLSASPTVENIPHLRRTRSCNNPPPLNGGSYCVGNDEDLRQCEIPCKINGDWSKWSEWSSCTPTCHRFRSRTCTSPPPMNGGSACAGRDLDTQPCNEGYCQPISPNQDITVYAGITCVVVLLFVIMALCSALICKRSRGKKLKKGAASNIYFAENGAHVRRVLLDQKLGIYDDEMNKLPQGSQFFTLASTCSPSPIHPSMTLRSGKSAYSGYSANRNVGSRAALITECSSSNSSSGGGKLTLLRTLSNCSDDDNYATLYDYTEEKALANVETSHSVLAAQVGISGARLQMRNSGATLLIPENTFHTEQMIYLAVSDQLNERPNLSPGETVLSPIVMFGECESERPSDSQALLQKPIVVSFRHCASVFPRDNWAFTIYADHGFGWHPVVKVGEENLNTIMHVYMEPPGKSKDGMGWCHVMTDSFCKIVLVGKARRPSNVLSKRVHLAAYGPDVRPDGPFEVRVYCVPETGSAMEAVARQEDRGRLLYKSEHFVLNEKGDLCFQVDKISPGFSVCGPSLLEIPDTQHMWCSQNGIHCSFVWENYENRPVEEFQACITVYQKANVSQQQQLYLKFESSIYDDTPREDNKVVTTDFHLPYELKEALGVLLDQPTDPEHDWRALARKLHFNRFTQFFGTKPGCSPTVLLLDLWEATEFGSIRARHDLLQNLRIMGRPDAVQILEHYLS